MNSQDEFQKLINELDKSPIFIMSLGSKELFHSNFWAYLMRRKDYKLFVYSLFEELEHSEPIEIKREFKNRDIVILYKNKEFVIENKIKSYPDQEQLKRYGEDINMVRGIVTGIKKPPFELPKKWTFVSYFEIASILRGVITEDKYLESIVLDYCNVLKSINTLMNLSLEETKGRLSYWTPNIGLLGNVRLMDVFRKLKADDFAIACKDIELNFKKLCESHNGWTFNISRSFHNGKATLSFEFLKYINEKYAGGIGIQIEDNQFRLFLGFAGETKYNVSDIFNIGKKFGWFDSSFNKKENRKVFGYYTSMSKNPCSYSGSWVYQYFDTWIKNKQDIQQYDKLKEIINEYINKAISLLDDLDKKYE